MPDLLYLNGVIVYVPGGSSALRCVARVTQGSRCRGRVYPRLRGAASSMSTPHGRVVVFRPIADAPTVARWLAQHCWLHNRPSTVDVAPVEWERFSPRDQHAWILDAGGPQLTLHGAPTHP